MLPDKDKASEKFGAFFVYGILFFIILNDPETSGEETQRI
jgi:hypothetical protein